jgi:hypothetical protein
MPVCHLPSCSNIKAKAWCDVAQSKLDQFENREIRIGKSKEPAHGLGSALNLPPRLWGCLEPNLAQAFPMYGSSASKNTAALGRVNRQFMVKLAHNQSVSTTPVIGMMPSRMALGGPVTQRS